MNPLIFIQEKERGEELKRYSEEHRIDACGNYKNRNEIKGKEEIAEYIWNEYDNMDEVERRRMVLKCMTEEAIKGRILEFELKNYKGEKVKHKSLDEYVKEAKKLFKRYQCKAGGYNIEDMEWGVYRSGSDKYDVRENEVLFENTISMKDKDDDETNDYLDDIAKRLERIAENIKIDVRFKKAREDRLVWILIWCTDTTKKKKRVAIEL